MIHPDHLKRNSSARAGDVLVLGKPLGVGILSAALKKDKLDAAGYAAMIDVTTRLNRPGPDPCQASRGARYNRRDGFWTSRASTRNVPRSEVGGERADV